MPEILVEVRPRVNSRTAGQMAAVPLLPEPLANRLGELADALKQLATEIGGQLDDFFQPRVRSSYRLDEIELKVNFDFESEAGVVIARVKSGASFEASMKWKRAESPAKEL